VAGPQQVRRHTRTHVAQTDETDSHVTTSTGPIRGKLR
jgi:hypothetical protein